MLFDKPADVDISYIITLYNKAAFIPLVIEALSREGGDFSREYIFVDDGSTDNSATVLRNLQNHLPGPCHVIEQENSGASAATNTGVLAARGALIRLVDGDDLMTHLSTARMIEVMRKENVEFVYGLHSEYDISRPFPEPNANFGLPEILRNGEGLKRFIRGSASNSSTMLITSRLYRQIGGCNETLVSPDYMLILRVFAKADGAFLPGPVTRIPTEAPGRLSGQRRRSSYELIIALMALLDENPELPHKYIDQAYRRAMSRAYNYSMIFGSGRLNRFFRPYLMSKIFAPSNPRPAMQRALAAFTEDHTIGRPEKWKTGAERRGIARTQIS